MKQLSLRLSRGPASSSYVHVCFHSLCVDVCVRKSQRGEESVSVLYCKTEWFHVCDVFMSVMENM